MPIFITILFIAPMAKEIKADTLKISDLVEATLSGSSAFDISSSSPKQQLISEKEPTRWIWIVTPKTSGARVLSLNFDAVVNIDGKDHQRSLRTLTRPIIVDVTLSDKWIEWLEVAKKTAENISSLWALIFVPVGAAVWSVVRKRGAKTLSEINNLRTNPSQKSSAAQRSRRRHEVG